MAQDIVLTKEGYEELSAKLKVLKSEGRSEIAEKLKVARSFGDLSENSEYDEAKSEQAKLEAEINDIETMLSRATIIDEEENSNTEVVHLGSVVTIKETTRGAAERTYTITGFAQANPAEGKISDESPIGSSILGHKADEVVDVVLPNGETIQFKVLEINR